ncbi:hypothetical protein [Salinimicrobium sediminis]|uniref:hypothetical protein n=1 Tax=Salinimicrobium sediminis TaxID=1343891 RepID=UPI000BE2EC51|nr:hypothetical protein [Salinimicrobium sediminis]
MQKEVKERGEILKLGLNPLKASPASAVKPNFGVPIIAEKSKSNDQKNALQRVQQVMLPGKIHGCDHPYHDSHSYSDPEFRRIRLL